MVQPLFAGMYIHTPGLRGNSALVEAITSKHPPHTHTCTHTRARAYIHTPVHTQTAVCVCSWDTIASTLNMYAYHDFTAQPGIMA